MMDKQIDYESLSRQFIQDEAGNKHESEVLTTQSPPYSDLAKPPVQDVMQWTDEKRKELKKEESLIITVMFKI